MLGAKALFLEWQARKAAYAMYIEDGIKKCKTIGQEIVWEMNTLASVKDSSSVQFSLSVVSHSLRPHESQHTRPPCPPPTPGIHSDSRPSSQGCHPAISSSVVPFSSCPQSLQASESFPMSQLFAWGSQSTGVSALASFLPKKSQGWSPSEWTGWISLQSKGLSIRQHWCGNRWLARCRGERVDKVWRGPESGEGRREGLEWLLGILPE